MIEKIDRDKWSKGQKWGGIVKAMLDKLDELVEENNRTKNVLLKLLKQAGWEEEDE